MIPDAHALWLFLPASLAVLVTPGPAVAYIVTRSVDQGRLTGVVAALGVAAGSLIHVCAAALGLSALLVSSSLAFVLVKYAGAAYLVWLGIRRLLNHDNLRFVHRPRRRLRRVFAEAVLVNLLNPKTALFFLAFLPQFVDSSRASPVAQLAVLGTLFALLGIASDGLYALLAGSAARWVRARGRVMDGARWFTGSVFIALGLGTAISGEPHRG